jgi:hypothetical protein
MRIRRWAWLLGVTWPDTWHMVSKPLSCFHPLFTREENIVFSRKKVFSSSRMIATTVRGRRASFFTDTLNLSTPKSPVEENSASSLTVHQGKKNCVFPTLWTFTFLIVTHERQNTLLLSPRCPLPSRELENHSPVRSRGRRKLASTSRYRLIALYHK